jgi:hypothetical protein
VRRARPARVLDTPWCRCDPAPVGTGDVPREQPAPAGALEDARVTYVYLRWLLILLPLLLLVVTTLSALQQGELETSISSYYGGPVRDVFVGVLVAAAACLVAYRGSSVLEDHTLNAAGFYAVFVAMVPNSLEEILAELASGRGSLDITPSDYVWSMRIALTAVLALCALLACRELRDARRLARLWRSSARNRVFVVTTALVLVGFLALAVLQLWVPTPEQVRMDGVGPLRVHDLAAVLLIGALAVAVWSHAFPEAVARMEGRGVAAADRSHRWAYRVILLLMVPGAPVVAGATWLLAADHVVIVLEWWEILLFCVFWVLQTLRVGALLRDEGGPGPRPAAVREV